MVPKTQKAGEARKTEAMSGYEVLNPHQTFRERIQEWGCHTKSSEFRLETFEC